MSIQEDLQLRRKGDEYELVGFTECTEESSHMKTLMTGTDDVKLANHVLQFVFLGHTGFRFPLAHYPTNQASPSELYLIFWKVVKSLDLYGFTVKYVSLDGAQCNRDFMKMFLNEKTSDTFTTMSFPNVFQPSKKIFIIMDYSHVMKKIRNNLSKSGHSKNHTKLLIKNSKEITWEHWYKAYQWEISSNPFKVYQQLTNDHFFLTSQSKMRNKLAEDVLNQDMLHLMKCYQKSLGDDGHHLDGSINLLEQTSILVKNFRDQRPIIDAGDERLTENKKVLSWFRSWEIETSPKVEKNLISHQTREDIISLLLGFDEMCLDKFSRSSSSIVPRRINSDVIENIFCQQRGLHNGANSNPTYLFYCQSMNSIILGSTTISKKSNSSGTEAHIFQQVPPTKKLRKSVTPLGVSQLQNQNVH
ncbi:uncharacterized protein LOC117318583 [Pecten maximus]|uniref:uncharacterized protein LOC117318583 n=1 Tax=Pecten maximus TaxID=6579 RepID=UPI0014583415|nr:uncharacterized protein LOC117318583 [Pecten maximus]